jgi:hypothetical protein
MGKTTKLALRLFRAMLGSGKKKAALTLAGIEQPSGQKSQFGSPTIRWRLVS